MPLEELANALSLGHHRATLRPSVEYLTIEIGRLFVRRRKPRSEISFFGTLRVRSIARAVRRPRGGARTSGRARPRSRRCPPQREPRNGLAALKRAVASSERCRSSDASWSSDRRAGRAGLVVDATPNIGSRRRRRCRGSPSGVSVRARADRVALAGTATTRRTCGRA